MDYNENNDFDFNEDYEEYIEALRKAFGIKKEDKPDGIVTKFNRGQWDRNCLIRASHESNREVIFYDLTDEKIPETFIYNPYRKERMKDNGHPFLYDDEFMVVIFGHDLSSFWKIARDYGYNSQNHHPENA